MLNRTTGVSNSQFKEAIRDNAVTDNTAGRAPSGVESDSNPPPIRPKPIDILSVTTSLPLAGFQQTPIPNGSPGGPSQNTAATTTLVGFANGSIAQGDFSGGPMTAI